ncbi:hypothetical protein O980_20665 [Mycobacterium avium subsp. paratuberculosis 08-8281]|nr:hypothetical protein O980_20665 [Mycobacterium avium subsp. paratuberculosis 08-8281]
MPSIVVNVAPRVAAERNPVWVGLESHRDSWRARWAASSAPSWSASSMYGCQPPVCQRSMEWVRPPAPSAPVMRRIGFSGSEYCSRCGAVAPRCTTVTPARPIASVEALRS